LDASYAEQIIEVFLSFSKTSLSAELLAVHGVVACFSNNGLTPLILEGGLKAYSESERSIEHRIWCLKISVVANMMLHLGHSSHFVDEVYGFIRLYQSQILKSLGLLSEAKLTLGDIEETCFISELFYALARAQQGPSDVLIGYQEYALRILSHATHYLSSPLELQKVIHPISTIEKESSSTDEGQDTPAKFVQDVRQALIRLSIALIAHFRWTSKADLILKGQFSALQEDATLNMFQVTMQTQNVQGCSLGNLFDAFRYFLTLLSGKLSNASGEGYVSITMSLFAAESVLLIAITQLALCMCMDDLDVSLVRELGKETNQSLQELESILRKSQSTSLSKNSLQRSLESVKLIEDFCQKIM
jgi:hypothetical protein